MFKGLYRAMQHSGTPEVLTSLLWELRTFRENIKYY